MEGKERMMIFIDLNNVEESIEDYRKHGMYLDYSHMVEVISEGYELADVKVYDSKPVPGNSELVALHIMLNNAGMDVILKDPAPTENNMDRTCTQKEVDTSLVADVVSCAYENMFDVAVIVSGDRDMRPAADVARRIGKKVIHASFYDVMCSEFKSAEDRMILDDLFVLEAVDSPILCDCRSVASFDVIQEAVADVS
ncbi:MAG: NYN domain-containing protein [Candidatus Methanomethylophilaceae archaeon]